MQQLKTLLVDDNPTALKELKSFIKELFPNINWQFKEADSFETAFSILSDDNFDISILDYDLGSKDCFELIKIVSKEHLGLIAINAIKGIEGDKTEGIEEYYWIPKPFSTKGIQKVVFKMLCDPRIQNDQSKLYFALKVDNEHVRIPFEEIWFIEGAKEYSKIYCKSPQEYFQRLEANEPNHYQDKNIRVFTVRLTMNDMLEKLNQIIFKRCHKSFIVNTKKINRCRLDGDGGVLYFSLYTDNSGFYSGNNQPIEIRFSESFREWLIENDFLSRK